MDVDLLIDFTSSLALLALLSWSYGILRRRLGGVTLAPLILGGLFGLVALLQMHAPIEPVEGLIIDMRVVPVALAGAFLGRAGLLACLSIAIFARYSIGGIGMVAGIAGICMAGLAGLIWHHWTATRQRRSFADMIGLGLFVVVSLASGMLLPPPWASWFFASAAPALALAYFIAVPGIGALLERERLMLVMEHRMKVEPAAGAATGLVTLPDFARVIAEQNRAGATAPITAAMVLKVRQAGLLSSHWEQAIFGHVLRGLRAHSDRLVRHGTVLAKLDDRSVAIALTAPEVSEADAISRRLRRLAAERAIALPGGDAVQVRVDTRVVPLSAAGSEAATIAALEAAVGHGLTWGGAAGPKLTPWGRRYAHAQFRRVRTKAQPVSEPSHADLFDKADRLLLARKQVRLWPLH